MREARSDGIRQAAIATEAKRTGDRRVDQRIERLHVIEERLDEPRGACSGAETCHQADGHELQPLRNTSATTSCRWAPSAILMPISLVRWVTAYARTE